MTASVTGSDLGAITLAGGSVTQRQAGTAGASATLSELPRTAALSVPDRGVLLVGYQDNEPDWLWRTLARFKPLFALEPNWDSYGAAAIDPKVAVRGLNFLGRVLRRESPAPNVVPTPDGGVQFEWRQSGVELEMAFGPGDLTEIAFGDIASGEEWSLEGVDVRQSLDKVRTAIARL